MAGGARWGGVEYAPLSQEEAPDTEDMATQGASGLTGGYGYGCMEFGR